MLQSLQNLQQKHQLGVAHADSLRDEVIRVVFSAGERNWEIYIYDEFHDFNIERQLLCVYLALRALDDYNQETDFLTWCYSYRLDATESYWLNYYRGLGDIVKQIEAIIGPIDPIIPQLDYELRSGAYSALLKFQNR